MLKRKSYRDEDLRQAVSEVKAKRLSLGKAAKEYGVPKTTIHDHVAGIFKSSKTGPPGTLTTEDEESLVFYITYMAERGFPITRKMLKALVLGIAQNSGRKTSINLKTGPSDEWCRNFLNRHSELAEKTPESQDKGRARMSNITVVNQYFDLLEATINKLELKDRPSQLFNCDETGFSGKEKSRQRVIGKRGCHAYQQNNLANSHITLHSCVSADGRVLPSFVIFEGNIPHRNFTDGVPVDWLFGSSDSGYMDGELFESWFEGVFLPHCGSRRPVLLVLDNHDSHISLRLIKKAIENNVELLGLPPHTTHLLQPLDVGLFGPLKEKVTSLAASLGYMNSTTVVGKAKFPALLSSAIDHIFTLARVKSSFEKCGLYPINRTSIDQSQLCPAASPQEQQPGSSDSRTSATTKEAARDIVMCHECGASIEIEPPMPENPLVKQGLIPEKLASILVPPCGPDLKRQKSTKIVTEARVLTGENVVKQLEEKQAEAKRMEEEKELRKVERIKKREEKDRLEEERQIAAEEKKRERERKKRDLEKDKQRRKAIREKKKNRRENNEAGKCIFCKSKEPALQSSDQSVDISGDISWFQCGVCDGWAHEICMTSVVGEDDEYMCDECLLLFEE